MNDIAQANPRTALVTGAGRGIGRATALALAAEGFNVAVLARTRDELDRSADAVRQAGRESLVLEADVADERAVKQAFEQLYHEWDRLDVLVNNAGWARFQPLEDTRLPDWERTIGVNLTGVFLCCREAIPGLERAGGGVIVNVSSSAGKKGYETQGAYVAAKHGVIGLSKTLAMELRQRRIHVHVVCPGGVDTRLTEEVHANRDRSDWMQPEDIADIIRFLVTRPGHLNIDEIVVRRFNSDVMF